MPRPSVILKRSLIFVHRWLGVTLSILFAMWFTSGIVMMYWSFPGVTERDRRERAPVLDPSRIKVTPEEAYASLGLDRSPGQAQLTSFDGRPVYRFAAGAGGGRGGRRGRGGAGGGSTTVYADDGHVQSAVDDAMIDRAATAWTGRPLSDAKKESVQEVDEWTVGGQLRALRPLYKYSFVDGQQVYVSARAEVMQYTTSQSRFWAYLGAIPHWMYFTPLRKHQPEWSSFVIWTSGIGTISALLGIVIAVWMLSPSKRYRNAGEPTSIPYRGWKRWHTIIGLVFGILAMTWALSGLLSMGPFDFVERLAGNRPATDTKGGGRPADTKGGGQPASRGGRGNGNIAGSLRGDVPFDLAAYAAKSPNVALASLGDFKPKELEFTMFAGEPQYIATNDAGRTRIIPVQGDPKEEFDHDRMAALIRQSAGTTIAEERWIDQYDSYYLDRRREKPLPVIYVRLNDETSTRYYIDPKAARVVGTYTSRGWVNRWLYHGLHSLDFPWLYNYRPLWDIVVIGLMLGGTALCVTSLILAWRVLSRKFFAAFLKHRPQPVVEDLA